MIRHAGPVCMFKLASLPRADLVEMERFTTERIRHLEDVRAGAAAPEPADFTYFARDPGVDIDLAIATTRRVRDAVVTLLDQAKPTPDPTPKGEPT